jgi:hypothetical protein
MLGVDVVCGVRRHADDVGDTLHHIDATAKQAHGPWRGVAHRTGLHCARVNDVNIACAIFTAPA